MRTLLGAMMTMAMAGSVAHAQTPEAGPQIEDRSADAATALAVGLPVLGLALEAGAVMSGEVDRHYPMLAIGAATMLIGPMVSHWYTHHIGGVGLAIRSAGIAAMVLGAMTFNPEAECDESCASLDRAQQIGTALVATGLATVATSIVYDVITSRSEVREWNRDHPFTIAPTAFATPSGDRAFGLAFGGRF